MAMNDINSGNPIYGALETVFESSDHPLSCAALMDRPVVRAAAISRFGPDVQTCINKLSDVLNFMWRKDILDRYPSTDPTTKSRYAYMLKPQPKKLDPSAPYAIPRPAGKSDISISECNGDVVIEFEKFTVTIRAK